SAAREGTGVPQPETERFDVDRIGAALRSLLGEDRFAEEFAAGTRIPLEDASAEAERPAEVCARPARCSSALGESHRTGEGRGRGGWDVYSAGAALSPEPAELIVAGLNAPDSSVRSSRLRRVISSHISLPARGSAGPGGTTVGRGSRPVVV